MAHHPGRCCEPGVRGLLPEWIPGFPDCAGVNEYMRVSAPRASRNLPSASSRPAPLRASGGTHSSPSPPPPARSLNRARHQSARPRRRYGKNAGALGKLGERHVPLSFVRCESPVVSSGDRAGRPGTRRDRRRLPRVPHRLDPDPRRRRSRAPLRRRRRHARTVALDVPERVRGYHHQRIGQRGGRGSRRLFRFRDLRRRDDGRDDGARRRRSETRGFSVRARG